MPKSSESTLKLRMEEIARDIALLQPQAGRLNGAVEGVVESRERLISDLPADAGGKNVASWAGLAATEAEDLDARVEVIQDSLEILLGRAKAAENWQIGSLIAFAFFISLSAVVGMFVFVTVGDAMPESTFTADAPKAPSPNAAPGAGVIDGGGKAVEGGGKADEGNALQDGATTGPSGQAPVQVTGDTAGSEATTGTAVDPNADTAASGAAEPEDENTVTDADAARSGGDGVTGAKELHDGQATGASQDTAQAENAPSEHGAAAKTAGSEQPQVAQHPSNASVLGMIMCLGAFGGALRLISSLSIYVAEEKLYRSWLLYYYLMPVEGALLATVVCFLVIAGIFDAGVPASSLLGLYAVAGFTGLFAKNAMRKLKDLADALFAKPSTTDTAD